MSGFETFIYILGCVTFSVAITTAVFFVIGVIERPRGKRR